MNIMNNAQETAMQIVRSNGNHEAIVFEDTGDGWSEASFTLDAGDRIPSYRSPKMDLIADEDEREITLVRAPSGSIAVEHPAYGLHETPTERRQ